MFASPKISNKLNPKADQKPQPEEMTDEKKPSEDVERKLYFKNFLKPEAHEELLSLFHNSFSLWYLTMQKQSTGYSYLNFTDEDFYAQQDILVKIVHTLILLCSTDKTAALIFFTRLSSRKSHYEYFVKAFSLNCQKILDDFRSRKE